MVHPCPSCGTRLKLSRPAAVARAKCPRCGASLGGPRPENEPAPAAASGVTRRAVVVVGVFAACLLLPLGLCLALLAGNAAPEQSKQPETRLAQADPAPGPSPRAPDRAPPAPGKDRPEPVAPPVSTPQAPGDADPAPGAGVLDTLPPASKDAPPTPADPSPDTNASGSQSDGKSTDTEPPTPKTDDPSGLGSPLTPKTPAPPPPPPPTPEVNPPPKKPQAKDLAQPVPPKSQQVSFLGTVAKGTRFCIIADNSGSMRGTPLETVKVELLKTLQSLAPDSQFHVSFFNSEPEPQAVPGWLKGGDGVAQVLPWLRTITARGGTEPTPAFEQAFQLDPKPDVIFFMTDGEIPWNVPDAVATLNGRGRRVPIHTILFSDLVARVAVVLQPGPRPRTPAQLQALARRAAVGNARLLRAAAPLQRIALQSGGTFRAVPVPPNPPRPPWAR